MLRKHIIRTTPLQVGLLATLTPIVTSAQETNFIYIFTVITELRNLIQLAVPVLIALALVLFLWGLIVFITQSESDQGRATGRTRMVWGVVILFVAVSVWGIVALLGQLSGVGQDENAPRAPRSNF
jgi:hypothetical protein